MKAQDIALCDPEGEGRSVLWCANCSHPVSCCDSGLFTTTRQHSIVTTKHICFK